MKKYYLNNGQENKGPFDIEEIRAQNINKNTLVWSDGMQKWKKAGDVDELKIILLTTPPPLNNSHYKNQITPKKNNLVKYLVIGICLIAFLAISKNVVTEENASRDNFVAGDEAVKTQTRNNISNLVQVTTNQYSVSTFGGISNLDVIVTNNTDYAIDQITVAIDYIKENGGIYTTEYLTFNNISANQNKSLSAPDTNRGLSVNLTKQTIAAADLNLCYDNNITPAVGDPDPYKCN